MKTKRLTLESFIKKIIKEEITKPYKSATNNELASHIIQLNKEIKAEDNQKKLELLKKDLQEVKAELASRKKEK
jgi:cob(I)alamin adenosyltransferase